jgi:hypothetical protein
MAVWAHTPKMQFFDSNGDPLTSGKVYTYEVGTTTNKATYPTLADAVALTNANANPVVLDSRGEAVIVITGPTKFLVATSADSTIYTVDNFYPETNGNIYDSNNKIILKLTAVASAVNRVEIKNAATGNAPIIKAEGEANIGLQFLDSNGNELFVLAGLTSAVNYVKISNSATGSGVVFSALGDDTNIDINFEPKGTGVANFKGTSTSSAELRLFEDTDNGTNYVGLKAPASISASVTYTLPSADGTNGYQLTTNGSGTLSWAAA